jgi:hypothetical protein
LAQSSNKQYTVVSGITIIFFQVNHDGMECDYS